MDEFHIVLFTGPIGVGKTTLAREWLRTHPRWVTVNFADLLRDVVERVYGIPTEDQKSDQVKNRKHSVLNGHTLRFALQWLGTEGFRTIHPDTWTTAWLRTVSQLRATRQYEGVLVEDCRFVNEFRMANAAGAFFVPVTHDKISKSWAAQIAMVTSPRNQLKILILRYLPWLAKFGLKAATIHESELQMMAISKELEDIAAHRILPFDNSEFDQEGDLVRKKVADLYERFLVQSRSLTETPSHDHEERETRESPAQRGDAFIPGPAV